MHEKICMDQTTKLESLAIRTSEHHQLLYEGPRFVTQEFLTPYGLSDQVAGASSDIDSKMSAVHAAVSAVDTAAADALWHCLSSMTNQMQSCMRENALLLHGMRALKVGLVGGQSACRN